MKKPPARPTSHFDKALAEIRLEDATEAAAKTLTSTEVKELRQAINEVVGKSRRSSTSRRNP